MSDERYAVVVVGAATAGAEAARIFAERGILTVVLDQNPRPYGKVEDGLPRWHVGLRKKEYETIDAKLLLAHVHFVPCTRLGRDVALSEIANEWPCHAIVLAHGAWRDRPLPIPGAEAFLKNGLAYQNPFIHWFNHYPEAGYGGEPYPITDGTIVVGGGLASIDVVKVLQLELTLRALEKRGIREDLTETEVRGIPETLKRHGLRWRDLHLEGSTLYYRRRVEDMPLVETAGGASEKTREKLERSRRRVLEKAVEKYLFRVEPLRAPRGLIVDGDRLAGLEFVHTRMQEGRLLETDRVVEVRAPMVISSIGSVPEPLPGIAMRGEVYDFVDRDLGRLEAYGNLFSTGNVVTGKGNIVASRKHARFVGNHVVSQYIRLADGLGALPTLSQAERERLLSRVRDLQTRVGYLGDYREWLCSVAPREPA